MPFPTPGDLPDPGTEPACLVSPELEGRLFTTRGSLGRFVYFDPKLVIRGPSFVFQQVALQHESLSSLT